MSTHPIKGKTITFTFQDGAMSGKAFEHAFHQDGTLDFGMAGGDASKKTNVKAYEVAKAGDDVYAVSYLGPGGFTLTSVLDFGTNRMVAFSSNEKELGLQHGTFTVA